MSVSFFDAESVAGHLVERTSMPWPARRPARAPPPWSPPGIIGGMADLDTWQRRELPILRAAVDWFDQLDHNAMSLEELEERSGLSGEDVRRGLRRLALAEPPLIIGIDTGKTLHPIGLMGVTERALVAVDVWPSPESLADRLIEALRGAAEAEPDEEASSRWRQLASFLGTTGRELLVEVTGQVISRGAGL